MTREGPLDSARSRRLLVALWLLLVVCLLPVREVIPPDEPRFAHQAQNMFDLGDWIVPRIGDVPYPDKPPILFWAIDLASLPAGRVTATTARIPSAIGALVVLLLTARLGRRLWGSAAVGAGGARSRDHHATRIPEWPGDQAGGSRRGAGTRPAGPRGLRALRPVRWAPARC